jgi:hypothetical protein
VAVVLDHRTDLVARAKGRRRRSPRAHLSTGEIEVEEMVETIRDGSMPPWQYTPTHPGARLSDQEKQDLIRGLEATFGAAGADGEEDEADE